MKVTLQVPHGPVWHLRPVRCQGDRFGLRGCTAGTSRKVPQGKVFLCHIKRKQWYVHLSTVVGFVTRMSAARSLFRLFRVLPGHKIVRLPKWSSHCIMNTSLTLLQGGVMTSALWLRAEGMLELVKLQFYGKSVCF